MSTAPERSVEWLEGIAEALQTTETPTSQPPLPTPPDSRVRDGRLAMQEAVRLYQQVERSRPLPPIVATAPDTEHHRRTAASLRFLGSATESLAAARADQIRITQMILDEVADTDLHRNATAAIQHISANPHALTHNTPYLFRALAAAVIAGDAVSIKTNAALEAYARTLVVEPRDEFEELLQSYRELRGSMQKMTADFAREREEWRQQNKALKSRHRDLKTLLDYLWEHKYAPRRPRVRFADECHVYASSDSETSTAALVGETRRTAGQHSRDQCTTGI